MHDATFDALPLSSPRVGDLVVARRELLAEVARSSPGLPPRWQLVHEGALGRVIGWRERRGEEPRAVVDLDGPRRVVVFVREGSVAPAPRSRGWGRS